MDRPTWSPSGLDSQIGASNWEKKGGFRLHRRDQRKEDAGLFLKGLYDLKLPYKFVVSGSGSLELKQRIHESLVGRKQPL